MSSLHRSVGAALAGVVVLAGVLWVLGPRELLSVLGDVDPLFVGLAVCAALCWLACWGVALYQLSRAVGVAVSLPGAVLVGVAGTAITNVTPTGEPFTAYLLAWKTGDAYEEALASVVALKGVNLVPTAGMAALGFVLVVGRLSGADQRTLGLFVVGFPLALLALLAGAWLARARLTGLAVAHLPGVLVAVSRLVPRWTPSRSDLRGRVRGFCGSFGRIAGEPRRLAGAVVASTLGWLSVAAALYCSLRAVGASVGVGLPLLAVPIGTTASATVLPGGLGGTEALLAAVLAGTSRASDPVVGAAVLLHRGATYWLPILLGGAALAGLVARGPPADQPLRGADGKPADTDD